MPARWHIAVSRRVNGLLGGDPDVMLCARAYVENWRVVPLIDAVWGVFFDEKRHCRHVAEYEALRRREPRTSVERFRRAEGG